MNVIYQNARYQSHRSATRRCAPRSLLKQITCRTAMEAYDSFRSLSNRFCLSRLDKPLLYRDRQSTMSRFPASVQISQRSDAWCSLVRCSLLHASTALVSIYGRSGQKLEPKRSSAVRICNRLHMGPARVRRKRRACREESCSFVRRGKPAIWPRELSLAWR